MLGAHSLRLQPGQGRSIIPRLTSFPVSRATGVCLTCAGAAARSELSKRRLTVQVRRARCHQVPAPTVVGRGPSAS